MPYDPNIVVESGQIWQRKNTDGRIVEYRVRQIYSGVGYKEVFADKYMDGKLSDELVFMGYLCRDGTPDGWSSRFTCLNHKTFSKVNQKTLLKRARDQLAATALTHRLTEQKEKP